MRKIMSFLMIVVALITAGGLMSGCGDSSSAPRAVTYVDINNPRLIAAGDTVVDTALFAPGTNHIVFRVPLTAVADTGWRVLGAPTVDGGVYSLLVAGLATNANATYTGNPANMPIVSGTSGTISISVPLSLIAANGDTTGILISDDSTGVMNELTPNTFIDIVKVVLQSGTTYQITATYPRMPLTYWGTVGESSRVAGRDARGVGYWIETEE